MQQRAFRGSGLTLNCLDYGGEGRAPILFLHGGSAHAHWWDFTAPHLTGDFHCLALDQRGHGDSEWAREWAYGSRHYVDDLAAIIGSWEFGAPVLMGHSMGGHNALLCGAAHGASIRGIVVIDSAPDYSQRAVDFLRSFADKPPRKFASEAEACANFRLLPRETMASAEVLNHVAGFTFRRAADGTWTHKLDRRTLIREPVDIWPSLVGIACPVLIIKVTQSFVLDREVARRMAAQLPHGTMAEIGNSYHHVMLDNPLGLVAVLADFLAGL